MWLRIENAFVPLHDGVGFGDITFYAAQVLAGGIIDHEHARKLFSVVLEELLTDRISATQSDPEQIDQYTGFEHKPGMVYVRVALKDVETHRAKEIARGYLENVLALGSPESHTWNI